MKPLITTLATAAILSVSASAQELFVKELIFPEGTDSAKKIEMAAHLIPGKQQKAWQERELTAFIHFGMNTFTNREWGDGTEDPNLFQPDSLDTDQWVSILKDAGFEMVILTAKHHDGFCLWPTATTTHSVASSPWRDGKGDVVADLRRSCDKYGMKLGLYLSPWDRNAPVYGDSPAYNDMFVAQLTELLTNYGKIDEVWFDGACGEGPNGKKQQYDWLRFRETMRTLQPEAVLAITGDDVRWVGNEGGVGRETEWSVTPLVPSIFNFADSVNKSLGIDAMSKEIGTREQIAKADRLYWWPSEVDVSIRPGWFWHQSENPRSLQNLAKIYLESVGRNSVLLLNIPPDNHGRIDRRDSLRLTELRQWIDSNFEKNMLTHSGAAVNCVVLEEAIDLGQRVESFNVLAWTHGRPSTIAQGTTIGKKRILTFDTVNADSITLQVTSSRDTPLAAVTGTFYIQMPDEEQIFTQPEYLTAEIKKQKVKKGDLPVYTIDLARTSLVAGFVYTPDITASHGLIFKYSIQTSLDGRHWSDVPVSGEFGNIQANPVPQRVIFSTPVEARKIRIRCLQTAGASTPKGKMPVEILIPAK